jgi:hypothetical protein
VNRRARACGFAALFAVAAWGCYKPTLVSPGYFCHPEDDPACPDGQVCVKNRCIDENAPPPGSDLAMSDAMTPRDFTVVIDMATGGPCQCSSLCPITKTCVGPECCVEDVFFGTCMPSTTCMQQMYP